MRIDNSAVGAENSRTAIRLPRRVAHSLSVLACCLALSLSVAMAQESVSTFDLSILTQDEAEKPIPACEVTLRRRGDARIQTHQTNERGVTEFSVIDPGKYAISVFKDGFEPVTTKELELTPKLRLEVALTLIPTLQDHQEITVHAAAGNPVEAGASPPAELQREQAKGLPTKPVTVADVLPLVPGVLRGPDGQIEISGAGENQSALLVNSADVTDPATGQFGPTVPIDSVDNVGVSKTPYLAQYGRFTAGVVTVETRRGGEKWHFELNDPLPEFRIRSLHLRGLRAMSPRLHLDGPVVRNKLYFSQSTEYALSKNPVRTLPFPFNESKRASLNAFSQLDFLFSPKHTLMASFHLAPSTERFVGLDFFNPQPVTPNIESHDSTISAIDRWDFKLGVLQSMVTIRPSRAGVSGQGNAEMILSPVGNRGNYFSRQDRSASRTEWQEILSPHAIRKDGTHNLQMGMALARSTNLGSFSANPVRIESLSGDLVKRIEFAGAEQFRRSDWEASGFVQDHWSLNPRFAVDGGVRWEQQSITGTSRFAPRAGFSWTPFAKRQTVVRGGTGVFYDHVPLNVYAFSSYPEQVVSIYGAGGVLIDGPRRYLNITAKSAASRFPFIDRKNQNGDFAPYSFAWSAEIEQPVSASVRLRAKYLENRAHGLLTLSPKFVAGKDALVLAGDGNFLNRQLELTAQFKWTAKHQVVVSYVRDESNGNLSEATRFLGNFPYPIVENGGYTNSTASVPNRLLIWGGFSLPWKMRVLPLLEYRSGFPYALRDVKQNYVGTPYSDHTRFPRFFSFDASLSKDVQITPKYAVQFTVRGLNLTNRFNPLAVHANSADPQFDTFFGNYNRRFRLDFDVLF